MRANLEKAHLEGVDLAYAHLGEAKLAGANLAHAHLAHASLCLVDLRNADLHDIQDTQTTRELYVAESRVTGIKRNRKSVLLLRAQLIAIAAFESIVDE